MPSPPRVTQLLEAWSLGDRAALDELIPLVDAELHRLAHRYMSRERQGHTMQTTALVNEAYLILAGQRDVRWQGRTHFFAIAAEIMRRIMIDHARRHRYLKRGGGARRVSLEDAADLMSADELSAELIALDDALTELAEFDSRKARVVELRFFGGLSVEETAEVLGVSAQTVKRQWRMAKAWLYGQVKRT